MAAHPLKPMIFLDGDYLGALAAARHLGQLGVPCYLVGNGARTIVSYSKYVTTIPCPHDDHNPRALRDFLLALPERFTGSVLYPASDDSAFFLGRFGAELSSKFSLAFPAESVIMALLDKEKLYKACSSWQIDTPHTIFPEATRPNLEWSKGFPVLIKPKTQIHINVQKKGEIAASHEQLLSRYHAYVDELRYHHQLSEEYPSLKAPMVQKFHKEAQTDTINVSGYFHPDQPNQVMLFTRKVLQKPRNIGIGLCFKAIPAIPKLAAQVELICKSTGYFGVYEAEFIDVGDDRYLLMDFNPRLYSQLQFDIDRGSLLPEFYYYEALKDGQSLSRLYAKHDQHLASCSKDRYSSYWYLRFTYITQLLMGKVSLNEYRSILREYDLHHPNGVDACYLDSDTKPYFFDQFRSYGQFLRHPRDTYRKFFKDAG